MDWNRSDTLALASADCTLCHGDGLRRTNRKGKETPCNCVLRGIFRACYARFRYCTSKDKQVSTVNYQFCGGKTGRRTWGRRDEEYVADFCLVAKRHLDETELKVFRFHFLLGADWRLCCRQLEMDRGQFFHTVYRIQQRLGRVFRELTPYALFPLDEYFGGTITKALPEEYENITVMQPRSHTNGRPALRRVA